MVYARGAKRRPMTRMGSRQPGTRRKRSGTEATPPPPADAADKSAPEQPTKPDPTASDAWVLDDGSQWIQAGGRFVAVRPETGDELRLRDHPEIDVLALAMPAQCGTGTCEGMFPAEFRFCPFCRAALQAPVPSTLWEPWYSAVARGVGETPLTLRAARASRPSDAPPAVSPVPLPDGGNFAFVSSPGSRRLFAFARSTGVVYAKARVGEGWKRLFETALADSLPVWSWACAMDARGFALATDEAPGWVALPWAAGRTMEFPAAERGATIDCLGGVGLSDRVIAAPALVDDRLALCWRSAVHDRWQIKPVDGAPKGRDAVAGPSGERSDFLGAPAQDARGNLYWAGVNGYLFCDPENGQIHEAGWIPWPNGQMGVPQHRPAADQGQSLYQLTMTETADGREVQYFACRMLPLRGDRALRGPSNYERVRGPFFSCGRTSVYENERFLAHPWDRDNAPDLVAPDGMSVLPLLVLGVHDGARHGTQWVYACAKRDEVPTGVRVATNRTHFLVDLFFADRSRSTVEELVRGLSIQSPFELALFLHDDQLHLYDASENRLYRLPLWAAV